MCVYAQFSIFSLSQSVGNCTAALPHILTCLSVCERLHLLSAWTEARLLLAHVHLLTSQPAKALQVIEAAYPQVQHTYIRMCFVASV